MTDAAKPAGKPFDLAHFLRSQLRNIAPLITLISLFLFFSIASPSFMTLDNLANILSQVSLTSIIAMRRSSRTTCPDRGQIYRSNGRSRRAKANRRRRATRAPPFSSTRKRPAGPIKI